MSHGGEVTYELRIGFVHGTRGPTEEEKNSILSWLRVSGVTAIADEVADGVWPPPVARASEEGGGPQDPPAAIAVYGFEREELVGLADRVEKHFAGWGLATAVFSYPSRSWQQAWQEGGGPITTERFFVTSNTRDESAPSGRDRILIRSGEAFGSGRHATSEVGLRALEQLPSPKPGARCLDVGTGTGVYLLAASALGYDELVGTDLSEDILSEARENLRLAAKEAKLLCTDRVPDDAATYDLVIANVLTPALYDLLPPMARVLKSQGLLIVAGFVERERETLTDHAKAVGLQPHGEENVRGWLGVILKKG